MRTAFGIDAWPPETVNTRLPRMARSMAYNNDDVPDIVQETALKLLAYADRFDPVKSSFSTWAYNIMRSVMVDIHRAKHPNRITYGALVDGVTHPDPPHDRLNIMDIVKPYPELTLYCMGYPYNEICDIMGIGLSCCKIRIHKARKQLNTIRHEQN